MPAQVGLVSFVDLIQMLAVRAIRHKRNLSLQSIRAVARVAEDECGFNFPFAPDTQAFLFGKEVVLRLPDDTYITATGKHANSY